MVRSDLPSEIEQERSLLSGHHKCGACLICPLTQESRMVNFPEKNVVWEPKSFSNCNTPGVIYYLECKCGKGYVGSTVRPLKVRVLEHISRVRNRVTKAPLTHHFLTYQHECTDLRVSVLEVIKKQVFADKHKNLLRREAWWIYRLGTLQPEGLNNELDLSVYL